MKDIRKFESLRFFNSERHSLRHQIRLLEEIIKIQRELLDFQTGKIFMMKEQLEEFKK